MGSEYAPVGVLLGDQSLTICKQPIYSAHYLSTPQLQAALQDSGAQVRRPTRGAAAEREMTNGAAWLPLGAAIALSTQGRPVQQRVRRKRLCSAS